MPGRILKKIKEEFTNINFVLSFSWFFLNKKTFLIIQNIFLKNIQQFFIENITLSSG